MKKIVFISKVPIHTYPRLQSIPYSLMKLGFQVIIIAPGNEPSLLTESENVLFYKIECYNSTNKIISKLQYWISFRIKTFKIIKKHTGGLLWLSSGDTAIALYGAIFKYKYILQMNELYDKEPIYRFLLKRLSSHSIATVVPEFNRANIIKVWFKLANIPFVLPNKSIISTNLVIPKLYQAEIQKITALKNNGFKIVIYQGHLSKDRDFSALIKAFNKCNFKIHLLLVGKDHGMLKTYLKLYDEITWIPHISPPNHLIITKQAQLGILYYDTVSLNNIYCAPNKIWEYSKFGIPMLSNNIPGMFETTKIYRAGITCNFSLEDEIIRAIDALFKKYDLYAKNSFRMYNSIDYNEIINNIVTISSQGSIS